MLQVFLANVPNRKHCQICSFHDGKLDVWNNFVFFGSIDHVTIVMHQAFMWWQVWLQKCHFQLAHSAKHPGCGCWKGWKGPGCRFQHEWQSLIFVDISVFFTQRNNEIRLCSLKTTSFHGGSTSVAYLFLPFTALLQLCGPPLWEGDLKPWNSIFFPLPEVETVTNPASPCIKFAS